MRCLDAKCSLGRKLGQKELFILFQTTYSFTKQQTLKLQSLEQWIHELRSPGLQRGLGCPLQLCSWDEPFMTGIAGMGERWCYDGHSCCVQWTQSLGSKHFRKDTPLTLQVAQEHPRGTQTGVAAQRLPGSISGVSCAPSPPGPWHL